MTLADGLAGASAEQTGRKVHAQLVAAIADKLTAQGLSPEHIGKVHRLTLTDKRWQGMHRADDGTAVVTDLAGGGLSLSFSPSWDNGPAWPVVQPARPCVVRAVKASRPAPADEYRTAVILPDAQIGYRRFDNGELDPFHCEKSIAVAMKIIRSTRPSLVVMLGDMLDLPDWGRFTQEPSFAMTTQASLDRAHMFLAEVKANAAPGAELVWLQGNHECLDEDTRAVTRTGLRSWKELAVGDEVLTVDHASGERRWTKIRAVHSYDHDGPMVRLASRHVDFLVTTNHRLVGTPNCTNTWKEVLAGDLTTGMRFYTSARSPQPDADISDDRIRLAAWALTDSFRSPDYGYWTFYQRASKAGRIRGLLDRLGITASEKVRDRNITEICGTVLKKRPEPGIELRVGRSAYIDDLVPDKNALPSWTADLSERQVGVFLDEFVYTDGSRKGGAMMLYVSRDALRESLQVLFTANGYRVTTSEYRPGHWRMNVTKAPSLTRQDTAAKDARTVDYFGKVWCVTVDEGHFFVERNGKIHLTGNSRINRAIIDNAKAAFGIRKANTPDSWPVMSIPHLLHFDDLGVQWVSGYPSGIYWINSNLAAIHGHRHKTRGSTAALVVDDERVSILHGHVHRVECQMKTRRTREGAKTTGAWSLGCLARIDGAVPGSGGIDDHGRPTGQATADWQNAIGVVTFMPEDGPFSVEPVPIFNGAAIFRGRSFSA